MGSGKKSRSDHAVVRPLAGLLTVVAVVVIVAVAVGLFQGSFTRTVPVTVVAERAGLEMNPDAKVKLHGAEVGKVATIDELPDGRAALHLAIDPAALSVIPADVGAAITSSTVFGAKFVELVPPASPSSAPLESGTVITGSGHVTVELNTVFQQLVAVLSTVDPAKLNQTLGAVSTALGGRGAQFGQTLADLDSALVTLNPALESLNHDLGVAAPVFGAVADAAPDLLSTVANATRISDTVVDEQRNLDALLLSAIGLADVGTEVLSANRAPLTELLHLLVPTTDLTNQYNPAITCGLGAMLPLADGPGIPVPGAVLLQGFFLGRERYRYPHNLPKVAAKGGPQCTDLPKVGFEQRPPFVITDIGANQAEYGNQGILLNSDGLKQALFGPLDGPPRNTPQMGQPG
ncbi:MAG: MCE family protein [Mycobacterium sp.]|nr:MCE family protein [Mycobacterium sp.]